MKRSRLRTLGVITLIGIAMVAASLWLAPLPSRLQQPDSQTVLWHDGSLAHTFLSPDQRWRLAGVIERVDPNYLKALLTIEDERFAHHLGVDPLAVFRALRSNLARGRIVSGASTLTMQLARLLEPKPRTLASKLFESWRALQLHARLGRQQVLANYLRFLPFGGNLEGVHGAAYAYFGHSAATLDAAEIATLLAVPQRPGARAPSPANAERLKAARDAILKRLRRAEVIDEATYRRSVAQAVPSVRRSMPQELPHAGRWLRKRYPEHHTVHSTLDASAQRVLRGVFERGQADRLQLGVRNGALVAVDHASRSLRALVGGADFFAQHDGAQIPAFAQPRHAASTLKPFLMGLAIDDGSASPGHLVVDVPRQYGSYRPRNFSGQFRGLVTLEEALTHSLNVPFVELIKRYGVERFIGRLQHTGLEWINPVPAFYGLSAALGTIPLSLLELTELYAALAQDGRVHGLRARPDEPMDEGVRLLTPEAAWMIRQALKTRDRPDFPRRAQLYGLAPNIHWKTGTSFGFHDAWSVGSDGRYTVGVWLGNLNRQASRYLVGAPLAGPLLFDAFDALGHQDAERMPDPEPRGLAEVEVCDFSGHLPRPACEATRTVKAPRRNVPTTTCPYHRTLYVKPGAQTAYARACAPEGATQASVLLLPHQARRYSNRLLPPVFTLDERCGAPELAPPSITSPAHSTIILIPGMSLKEQLVALQATASEGSELSWFVNGRFLGNRRPASELWWEPRLGEHLILVKDASGRSSRKRVVVRAR